MSTHPKISIITVNYNQSQVTLDLVDSLMCLTYPNVEIIIVDNFSTSAEYGKLIGVNNHVKVYRTFFNKGFAGGNNVGLSHATGDFLLFLNNDTIVAPGFLEPLVESFQLDPMIGIVCPKIKFYDDPNLVQYAGFTKMNPFTLRMNGIGYKKSDSDIYNHPSYTEYAHGCAMMLKREVIDKAGPMPEEYFLYYEELDWSYRIKNLGYKIYYQPLSMVLHKESMSTKKGSTLKTYYMNRNRILFMRKNYPIYLKVISFLYILFISVPKNILHYSKEPNKEHLKAYLKAIYWNITNLKI